MKAIQAKRLLLTEEEAGDRGSQGGRCPQPALFPVEAKLSKRIEGFDVCGTWIAPGSNYIRQHGLPRRREKNAAHVAMGCVGQGKQQQEQRQQGRDPRG